jgi:hypothetical protein
MGIFERVGYPPENFLLNPRPDPTRPGFVILNPNPRKMHKIRPDRLGSGRGGSGWSDRVGSAHP